MDLGHVTKELVELRDLITHLAQSKGCRDPETAYSNTALACLKSIASGNKVEDPRRWIIGIAKNEIRRILSDCLRRNECELVVDSAIDPFLGPLDHAIRSECREHVQSAIGRLPKIYRDVILSCDISEESLGEYAKRIGAGKATCETRRKRGRKMLKDDLQFQQIIYNR
ncbi:hypothetical protein GC197_18260 [bacterium]|nr:hypothetical protein [bacterium]